MPRKVAKKVEKPAPARFRASWHGTVSFGLVSFPAHAINAFDRQGSDVHFRQIHAGCHRRIEHHKVCPVHGEVAKDEIVSGYETESGGYVEVEPEELDALRTDKERSLTIDAFVDPEHIDPIYLDGRMYYLAPDSPAAMEPYAVMADAMQREGRVGVGQVVFSGKEQLAILRAVDGVLHMAMLNYDKEIRRAKDVVDVKPPAKMAEKVKLAQTLIRQWSPKKFDFTDYDDHYRDKVKAMLAAKSKGKEIEPPPAAEGEADVYNFMDALKKSLQRKGPTPAAPTGLKRKRKKTQKRAS